jgi:hypothetical protein
MLQLAMNFIQSSLLGCVIWLHCGRGQRQPPAACVSNWEEGKNLVPKMARSSRRKSASRMSPTMPISKKSMTASGTCFTWRAHARDHLLVTGVEPASEFAGDFEGYVPRKGRGFSGQETATIGQRSINAQSPSHESKIDPPSSPLGTSPGL